MVVRGEAGLPGHLPGEEAAGHGDPGEDPDVPSGGFTEEQAGGALAEDVEDDLHRLHAGELDGLEGLLYLLDAHPVVADFALGDEAIEHLEDGWFVVDAGRGAVQLQQVQAVGLEVDQAALDPGAQVGVAVALDRLLGQAASRLCRHDEGLPGPLAAQAGQVLLAAAVAVHVGGVEEGDSGVESGVEGPHGVGLAHFTPLAAEGPRSEADLGYLIAGAAEPALLHLPALPRG